MKPITELISSRSNPIVKWAFSLQDKKNRDMEKTFIAEGEKLTYEAIKNGLDVTHIFISESKKDKILPRLLELIDFEKKNIKIFLLSESAFEKISTEKAPQGVISAIKYLDFFLNIDIIYRKDFLFSDDRRIMILSSVRDPGNLGSVIRSAAALGTDTIILSSDCADVYNPKTVRSSMGSIFKVKILIISNLSACIKDLQNAGKRVFAAELRENAVPLTSIDIKKTDVFVIGNEGHGIDENISSVCNGSVYIPITENAESLNASVAAALFIWEQSKL